MKNKKIIFWILGPALLHVFIFMVIPIIAGVVISFMSYNPLRAHNGFVGLANFQKLLTDTMFLKAFSNTMIFVFVTVTLNIVLSLIIAQLISYFKSNKIRSFFRMIFFLPCVAPIVASTIVFSKTYFSKTSLINLLLKNLGLSTINWLGDPKFVMIALIIFTLWVDMGYNIILFSAGIDGIPEYVYEAADLDGASEWSKFKRITLPLLGRSFIFVSLMTLISHFQMFAQFAVMVYKDGPQYSGLVLSRYIFKQAFELKEMGYGSAIALVLFIVIFVISIIQQKVSKVDWEY